jgi:Ubiquitin carboxyl-terminal hydrolase
MDINSDIKNLSISIESDAQLKDTVFCETDVKFTQEAKESVVSTIGIPTILQSQIEKNPPVSCEKDLMDDFFVITPSTEEDKESAVSTSAISTLLKMGSEMTTAGAGMAITGIASFGSGVFYTGQALQRFYYRKEIARAAEYEQLYNPYIPKPETEKTSPEVVIDKKQLIIDQLIKEFQIGKFYNVNSKCWMHSSTQLLLVMEGFLLDHIQKLPKSYLQSNVVCQALLKVIEAAKSGDNTAIDNASKALHTALCSKDREYCNQDYVEEPKKQHDAASYFASVLGEINFLLQMRLEIQGNGDHTNQRQTKNTREDSLHLPILEGKTFQETIDDYFQPHIITDENDKWRGFVISRTETHSLPSTPEVLFIQLKRFTYTKEYQAQKISSAVEFLPNESQEYVIDLSKKIAQERQTKEEHTQYQKIEYELIGVIHHHGWDCDGGHYTANVLRTHPETGERKWFFCDDIERDIQPIPYDQVSPETGYVFAFRLKKGDAFQAE